MKQRIALPKKAWAVAALLLALVLALVCQLPMRSQAASYLDTYLERMVDLGLMQGDPSGNLRPNDSITRSEFVTIVNRAFGYNATAGYPFVDVHSSDWFSEDVDISYTEGYITGTTPTTFSPNVSITREEAAFILAKNLMMEPSVGEDLSFTDSRNISTWSRGLVSTAARYNLISGYPDGSFAPQRAITRGEAAVLLLNAVGTLVQEPGVQTLGDVWGNVTITTSGVTLRNTMVAGNLYITAGVGLGGVTLENVTVLGEIIVSGGGVSEAGDDSIIFRNVTAPSLVLDNITNQQVSLRVEGNGVINEASVRTNAVVTDAAADGRGVLSMELNGEEGLSLDVAGNIKELVNRTPGSALNVASGQAAVITVDETATDSTLNISSGASVGQVNLDVGTTVTGDGDIDNLVVNAPGSTVSMLPDQITIRPGVTADINGQTMDSEAAAESSSDPRLLAGYPQITNLAPNTATAVFSGNKSGTVHWAVTSVTDGSADVSELLDPPAYGGGIVQNGTVNLSGSSQPVQANLTGLTSDGSYYLAAVMVDARGDQSPLKVISFTTPDNTVPRFADGYPYMSQITNVSGQAAVMATKTCRLYWAVLPDGAAAPTAQDFRANAVTGNLGFGSMDVTKNTSYTIDVNNVPLTELETYDLYLWLTDVDGGQSSAVQHLEFTTVDRTPPRFNTNVTVNNVQTNSVGLYANLDEDGTLFWVVVVQGEEYPKPLAGQSGEVSLSSDIAKMQVANGMNALNHGQVTMREDQDVSFTVSGLQPETAYDLYYVARDQAGNYSATVQMITIHTLDSNAPTVTQEFTDYPADQTTTPYPDTDIRLVFSEEVQYNETNTTLVDYYEQKEDGTLDEEEFGAILRNCIRMYTTDSGRAEEVPVASGDMNKATGDWVIDYRYAQVILEEGKTVVIFPTESNSAISALNLESGATYYFEIQSNTIADTSDAKNVMGTTRLEPFTTVFAIVNLSNPNESEFGENETVLNGTTPDENDRVTFDTADDRLIDVSWILAPESTESVPNNVDWDMIIWSNVSVEFDLYAKEMVDGGAGTWELIGDNVSITVPAGSERIGVSLTRIMRSGNNPQFDQLNTLKENTEYEYAIHFNRVGTLSDRNTWSQRLLIGITVVAGTTDNLQSLAFGALNDAALETELASGLMNIGIPDDFELRKQFSDQTPPVFTNDHPIFEVGDSMVNMLVSLDRPGTVYYVIAPIGTIPTTGRALDNDGNPTEPTLYFSPTIPADATEEEIENILEEGYEKLNTYGGYGDQPFSYPFQINSPTVLQIVNADFTNSRIKYGSMSADTAESEHMVENLEANQNYIAYFVIQGTSSQVYSEQVYAYRFTTSDVDPAYITLRALNPEVEFTTSQDANLYYVLYAANQLPDELSSNVTLGQHLAEEYMNAGLPSTTTNKTLLQAIQDTYDSRTGESYFDHYASEEIKNTIYLAITSQSSSGAMGKGNIQGMLQNNAQERDLSSMMNPDSGTYYICLATAQNRLGGEWTFKAVDGVRIPDEDPPVLTNAITTVEWSAPAGNVTNVSGTIMLQFSENIYHINEDGDPSSLRPILQIGADEPSRVGFLNLVTSNGVTLGYQSTSTSPSNSITLTFSAPVGASFSFCNTGRLADASATSRTGNTYVLQLVQTDLGYIGQAGVGYEFRVIQGIYENNN